MDEGRFTLVDEVAIDPDRARVYEHGWQSWSPTGIYPVTATSVRPTTEWQRLMRFRPGTPPPATGFQGEGLLVLDPGNGEPMRVYSGADLRTQVPSIRGQLRGNRFVVTADGPVDREQPTGTLGDALGRFGTRTAGDLGATGVRPAPTVWCSWYHYFLDVTEDDIVENLLTIDEHELPVDVVQVDDGWQREVGDWLDLSPRFTSMADLAQQIRDRGRRAGIWVAPFTTTAGSLLAQTHPDWLVGPAGYNWGQDLLGLDLTHPEVIEHLRLVFSTLREWGFDYFKLDFMYGGAVPGPRKGDPDEVAAYRAGLATIRDTVGDESYLLGCGAPILPSIGFVDAMRISPDAFNPTDPDDGANLLRGRMCVEGRAWQQGRFWVNDADCIIVRPGFDLRPECAEMIERYSGLRASSDRIADLDDWGLDTTRRLLATAPDPVPFATLPAPYHR